jgi:glutamine synthetase
MIANRHGASATFLPKLELGAAGSGMHLHLALERDGVNTMRSPDGELSEDALRVIGSLLDNVSLLSALGNTVAASYLRLVPGQEAPTRVCWGRHDRSSLVRIPLDFRTEQRLDLSMNPNETGDYPELTSQATVEFRSPDGSAFSNLLLASLAACVSDGLSSERALEVARRLEVASAGDLDDQALETLPASAREASERLQEQRAFLEERSFPAELIDMVREKLRSENDRELEYRLRGLPAADRLAETRRIMHKDLHKH